ncbi:MAG: thioesterase family protein [bacterium]
MPGIKLTLPTSYHFIAIQYRSQAHWGDQVSIDLAVTDFSSAACDIYYRLVNRMTQKEVARIKTGISFFDYSSPMYNDQSKCR